MSILERYHAAVQANRSIIDLYQAHEISRDQALMGLTYTDKTGKVFFKLPPSNFEEIMRELANTLIIPEALDILTLYGVVALLREVVGIIPPHKLDTTHGS